MYPFSRKSPQAAGNARHEACGGASGTNQAPAAASEPGGEAHDPQGDAGDAQAIRRLHLVFVGEVQGVGFRWTARHAADACGCTGWVRNESDGSVTLELQ